MSRQIRTYLHDERARLGADFCLSYPDEKRCQAEERREEHRSQTELLAYCAENPATPRCLGAELHKRPDFPDSQHPPERRRRDDFFGSRGLPDPSDFRDEIVPTPP